METEKIHFGIYGGTFDPVHRGHLHAALSFYDGCALDQLVVVPSFIPPHKPNIAQSGKARLDMLHLTFSASYIGERNIEVSDYEITRGDISYTVYLLKHFSKENRKLYFLCGTDMFLTLHQWYKAEEFFRLAVIVHMAREEETAEGKKQIETTTKYFQEQFGAQIIHLEEKPFVVSSEEIRKEMRYGQNEMDLVVPEVSQYIRENRLYLSLEALKERVEKESSHKRFLHVQGVEKECSFLADIFCPEKKNELRIAAFLHDIAKEYSYEEQIEFCRKREIPLESYDRNSVAVLHALTGAELAREKYGEYCSDEILEAIRCHSTGKADMTLFEKLLFLADFIEEGRTYESCRNIRNYFHEVLKNTTVREEKISLLDRVLLRVMNQTIQHLMEKNQYIHPKTIFARNSIVLKLDSLN